MILIMTLDQSGLSLFQFKLNKIDELTKVSLVITLSFKREKVKDQDMETGECIMPLLKNMNKTGVFMPTEPDLQK